MPRIAFVFAAGFLFSAFHCIAGAIELVPLTVTPVSIGARANGASSDVMTNTASVTLVVSEPDLDASFSVTGTVGNNAITYSSSLSVTPASNKALGGGGHLDVTVAIEVPFVGGATTPVIALVENGTTELLGNNATGGGIGWNPVTPGLFSNLLGQSYSPVSGISAIFNETTAGVLQAFGGDTVELSLVLSAGGSAPPGGEVNISFTLSLYTVSTAPGSGDLNADGLTDILDSTLLRRTIAGLPTN